MPIAFFSALLCALLASASAGVTKEMIPGIYRRYKVRRIDVCPEIITFGPFTAGYINVTTAADCGSARIVPVARTAADANATDSNADNLPPMARDILANERQSGTVITAEIQGNIFCKKNQLRHQYPRSKNRLKNGTRLTFLRPRETFQEFGVTFSVLQRYVVFRKRSVGLIKCIYVRDEDELVAAPGPGTASNTSIVPDADTSKETHKHKNGTSVHSHSTGTVKIALWAWLGPLIGGILVCLSLLVCVLWRYRRDRWYPFNGTGQPHEDASDSEMFGRLSGQNHNKSSSFERAPSGIVFENSNDTTEPSDDYHNNRRV